MNIKQIVEERLRKDGYDGLCCDGCGCRVDALMPCGEPPVMECRPGHIRHGTFMGGATWIIVDPNASGEGPQEPTERKP